MIERRAGFPRRLSERGLCAAIPEIRRQGAPAGIGGAGELDRAHAKPWRAICSSSWPTRTSMKWRGSTAMASSEGAGRALQGRPAEFPSGAAAAGQARSRDRASAQAGVRSVDADGVRAAGAAAIPARHGFRHLRPQPRSGDASARSSRNTATGSKDCCRRSRHAKLKLAVEIASLPEHIRGFGHVKERHLAEVESRTSELLAAYHGGKPAPRAIAAE